MGLDAFQAGVQAGVATGRREAVGPVGVCGRCVTFVVLLWMFTGGGPGCVRVRIGDRSCPGRGFCSSRHSAALFMLIVITVFTLVPHGLGRTGFRGRGLRWEFSPPVRYAGPPWKSFTD